VSFSWNLLKHFLANKTTGYLDLLFLSLEKNGIAVTYTLHTYLFNQLTFSFQAPGAFSIMIKKLDAKGQKISKEMVFCYQNCSDLV
jgi:hypothetical protein